jgi:hypothetical protein
MRFYYGGGTSRPSILHDDTVVACLIIDLLLLLIFFEINHAKRKIYAAQSKQKISELPNVIVDVAPNEKLVAGFQTAFHHPGDATDPLAINFRFDSIGLTLPTGLSILESVQGEIHSGKLTAIMGPSVRHFHMC